MKKIIVLLSVISLLLVLCSCDDKIYHWSWEYEDVVSQIKEVHIVELDGYYKYTITKTIPAEKYLEIIEDIAKIEFSKYWGPPDGGSGTAILIIFINGEYDVISDNEPIHMRYYAFDNSGKMSYTLYRYFCDEKQFNALIDKYMSIE